MTCLMPRPLPLHVVKETSRHGKVVFYFRIGKGERFRLPGKPGSKEFKIAYQAALIGQTVAVARQTEFARSLRWLVRQHMESAKWGGLSVATRKQRGLFYNQIVEASGDVDCRAVRPKDIRTALERRKSTPALANNFLKAMSALFKWGLQHEHVDIDPTIGVERFNYKSDGFPIWTWDEIERYMDYWPIGTQQRLALELLIALGLRRSDIVRAGRQHMSEEVLALRTIKTNTPVTIELPERVIDMVQQTETGDLVFIVGKKGRPMTKETFGNWFRDACRAAGIMKSAHGVRKFSATLAAEGGATTHQLMAQFGWVTTQQAELYTKGADRALLGKVASRIVSEQIETRIAPHLESGAGKNPKNQTKSDR